MHFRFKEISDINDKQKEELREAHEKVEELKKCLVEKNEGIETHNRRYKYMYMYVIIYIIQYVLQFV